ncbi:SCO-spondin-like [Styela clava]
MQRVLLAVVLLIYFQQTSSRWCSRNVTKQIQTMIGKREENSVPCLDLYKYVHDKWKYDEQKMKNVYGGSDGVASYFYTNTSEAHCFIYKTPIKIVKNVTERHIECCTGWTGPSCEHRHMGIGICYEDINCQIISQRTLSVEQKFVTVGDCCTIIGGKSWRTVPEISNVSVCHTCNDVQLVDMTSVDVDESQNIKASCGVFGGRHLGLFSGKVLQIPTNCAYQIAVSEDGSWSLEVQSHDCDLSSINCSLAFRMTIEHEVIVAYRDVIFNRVIIEINEKTLNLNAPIVHNGVIIKRIGQSILFESSLGFSVRWDAKNSLFIYLDIPDKNTPDTTGLCGSWKFAEPLGRDTRNHFHSSTLMEWRSSGIRNVDEMKNLRCTSIASGNCDADPLLMENAQRRCDISRNGPFADCIGKSDPTEYIQACTSSVCLVQHTELDNEMKKQITCSSMSAYALKCHFTGINVGQWMKEYNCEDSCPDGMIYKQCVSACPLTCENFSDKQKKSQCTDSACFPGCECENGRVLRILSNGETECVDPNTCPCKHRGKEYQIGQSFTKQCNLCKCESRGRWNCSEDRCEGTCNIISASHVVTFDGTRLSLLRGPCKRQILLRDRFRPGQLTVSVDILPASNAHQNLFSISSLLIDMRGTQLNIKNNLQITVNGTESRMPYRDSQFSVRMATSLALLIRTHGVSIIWIPSTEELELVLDPMFSNKVIGLCGTYNWNSKDDLLTPQGDIEPNIVEFTRSYQEEDGSRCLERMLDSSVSTSTGIVNMKSFIDDKLPNACTIYAQRRNQAQQLCALLSSEIFDNCLQYVTTSPYIEMCMHDICTSDATINVCRVFSAYARACANARESNNTTNQQIDWRQHEDLVQYCNPTCPLGMVFNECQPLCSSSCDDVRHPCPTYSFSRAWKFQTSAYSQPCLPGCVCPDGMYSESLQSAPVISGEQVLGFKFQNCVKKSQCSCSDGGLVYTIGKRLKSGCSECICNAGRWNCTSESCDATMKCPNNMIFSRQMSLCNQDTCDNVVRGAIVLRSERNMECASEVSFQGCTCPNGMVLEGEHCIDPTECPCKHNGQTYQRNSTIKRDCNTCTCDGKHWICTEKVCAGICVATGDPHYVTFDGATYSFEGACSYILAQDSDGLFSVEAENIPCGSTGVTCTKSVYISIGNMVVHLLRGKDITVNGARVRRFPRRYGASDKPMSKLQKSTTSVLIIDKAGLFVVVSAPVLGLSVLWDGGTRVYVQVYPEYRGKTSGLCGNYNLRTDDDYTTRHGSVEASVSLFADTWRLAQSCPETRDATDQDLIDPCKANPHREGWARRTCSIITTGSLFAACRIVVGHSTYYDWCVRDSCACDSGGDCECLCTAIAAFAEECNRHGVHIRWRSQKLCPMQCDNGMEYKACGPVCQSTCRTIGSEPEAHCGTLSCVEGCFCPIGTVLHDGSCVSSMDCPCPMNGGEFPSGTTMYDDCKECVCRGGKWECEGKPCSEARTCAGDHFQCAEDDRCIPIEWKCDMEVDCSRGSDEKLCEHSKNVSKCESNEFGCGDGFCIAFVFRCDGSSDCLDGSDEIDCEQFLNKSMCEDHEFLCDNGKCIHSSFVCDGQFNCGFGDFADEINCAETCSQITEFECSNSECISRYQLCDGVPDCTDNSDEIDCVCTLNHFTCADNNCISRTHVCNGINECSDGEDEHNCYNSTTTLATPTYTAAYKISTTQLSCPDRSLLCPELRTCLPHHMKCDGVVNCPSGLDEIGCNLEPTTATSTEACPEFSCSNDTSTCVRWKEVCDHVIHCPDQSDESIYCWEGCTENMFDCDKGVRCLPFHLVCDQQVHCIDLSDESQQACEQVNINLCTSGFQCDDGPCISGNMVCDGVFHCSNGEDELGCPVSSTQIPIKTLTTPVLNPTTTSMESYVCPEFTCPNGFCLEFNRVCDGVNDCYNTNTSDTTQYSDEFGCPAWSEWQAWGFCSKTCGSGLQTRNRSCKITNTEDPLRKDCKGKVNDTRPCYVRPCEDNQSNLLPWSTWSECSSTCGGGVSVRMRECNSSHTNCINYSITSFENSQVRSCNEEKCFGDNCGGSKMYVNCDGDEDQISRLCAVTCQQLNIHNMTEHNCSQNFDIERKCISGCYCPDGYVYSDDTATECVPVAECPCYYNNEVFQPGEQVEYTTSCEICTCKGGDYIGDCELNPACIPTTETTISIVKTTPDECGWSNWSEWGPCFGPCGVNGVQWSFRSPTTPGRYGSERRHCPGETRKSRRCPTEPCEVCTFQINGSDKTKNVGEQWKEGLCKICSCNYEKEVKCQNFCKYSANGCPDNGTLILPDENDGDSCCYCQLRLVRATELPSTTVSFSQTSKVMDVFFTSSSYETTRIYDTNADTTMKCGLDKFQCRESKTCISKSNVCDGVVQCIDGSDESDCGITTIGSYDTNCEYQLWTEWSICSKSCGVGKQTRQRGIISNRNADKLKCLGPFKQTKSCFTTACKINGDWSNWQEWTDCSKTCGGGVRFRVRSCDNPSPGNGGIDCDGENMESLLCGRKPCYPGICTGGQVFVKEPACKEINTCEQTCSDRSNNVKCSTNCTEGCYCPNNQFLQDGVCVSASQCRCSYNGIEYNPWDEFHVNGCPCKCENGVAVCSNQDCVVNCGWSDWSLWTSCDKTCGTSGRVYRFRSPTSPPPSGKGAKPCIGKTTELRRCFRTDRMTAMRPCSPVWSAWNSWTHCSAIECELGSQTRTRDCTVENKKTSVAYCGSLGQEEKRVCTSNGTSNSSKCESSKRMPMHPCPKDAVWECQQCPKTCANLASQGDKTECLVDGECIWSCLCPDGLFLQNNQCVPKTSCDCTLPDYYRNNTNITTIENGSWIVIECHNCSCANGRLHCELRKNDGECENIEKQAYEWTPWSEWSKCSKSCITRSVVGHSFQPVFGVRTRKRQCLGYESYFYKESNNRPQCNGSAIQAEKCGKSICSLKINWGEWQNWSPCDRSCNGGMQTRKRTVLQNNQEQDIEYYYGPATQIQACALAPCKESKCPTGSSYKETCSDTDHSTCSEASTCFDLSSELYSLNQCGNINKTNCVGEVVKSCQCNTGLLWQDGICVPLHKCNCFFMGQIRRFNQSFPVGNCLSCMCSNGTVACKSRRDGICSGEEQACDDATLVTGPWSQWTACSQSCDLGQRRRIRSKLAHPSLLVFFKKGCNDVEVDIEDCKIGTCNIHEENTTRTNQRKWTKWGGCSVSCGNGGWMNRYRKCSTMLNNRCQEKEVETKKCDIPLPPCSRDGSWGEWQTWSQCSSTCISNTCTPFRSRVRKCDDPLPMGEGEYCAGSATDIAECNHLPACNTSYEQIQPDQCNKFIRGSKYSACGPVCPRTCSDLQFCKQTCVPGCYCPPGFVINSNQTECISKDQCQCYDLGSGKKYKPGEEFVKGLICKQKCKCTGGIIECDEETFDCIISGSWCPWSRWTSCTRSCGAQNRTRMRSCECPAPSNNEDPNLRCKVLKQTPNRENFKLSLDGTTEIGHENCHIYPHCPDSVKRLGWTDWGEWTPCTCQSLFSSRNRTCESNCEGPWLQFKPCRFDPLECGFQCPPGLILSPCGSGDQPDIQKQCPDTCLGLNKNIAECNMEEDEMDIINDRSRKRRWNDCVPQCACPHGLLLDPANTTGSLCVSQMHCPCYSRDLKEYKNMSSQNFIENWKQHSIGINRTNLIDCRNCSCRENGYIQCDQKDQECIKHKLLPMQPEWSEWSKWSDCSVSCNGGTQWRARLCLGANQDDLDFNSTNTVCEGDMDQERPCKSNISCTLLPWQGWSECSVSCGMGTHTRTRICRDNARCLPAELKQMKQCTGKPCPPHWSSWSKWSNCNGTCGTGIQTRERLCTNITTQFLKSTCADQNSVNILPTTNHSESIELESKSCKAKRPCNKPGHPGYKNPSVFLPGLQWSAWSPWSGCSVSCGGGICVRKRKCEVVMTNTGDEDSSDTSNIDAFSTTDIGCTGETNQSKSCHEAPCPVNGRCPERMEWKTCQQLCGDVTRHPDQSNVKNDELVRRPVSCSELSSGSGEFCSDLKSCTNACVCENGGYLQRDGRCVPSDECECMDDKGRLWPPLMQWEETGLDGCNSNCSCTHGRVLCHKTIDENGKCVRDPEFNSCYWTLWTPWTACNTTCKDEFTSSVHFRFRSHLNMKNTDDETLCQGGTDMQTKPCGSLPPCHCKNGIKVGEIWKESECLSCQCSNEGEISCQDICWSDWSSWSSCSSTCGTNGIEKRLRTCIKTGFCEGEGNFTEEVRKCQISYGPCTRKSGCNIENCPEINCRNGQVEIEVDGECCPRCVNKTEIDGSEDIGCMLKTETRNITINGCTAADVNLRYCSGTCRSAVHIVAMDPFIHSRCECCSHVIDKNEPFIALTLYCDSAENTRINLPNISDCKCSTCSGTGLLRAEP